MKVEPVVVDVKTEPDVYVGASSGLTVRSLRAMLDLVCEANQDRPLDFRIGAMRGPNGLVSVSVESFAVHTRGGRAVFFHDDGGAPASVRADKPLMIALVPEASSEFALVGGES